MSDMNTTPAPRQTDRWLEPGAANMVLYAAPAWIIPWRVIERSMKRREQAKRRRKRT